MVEYQAELCNKAPLGTPEAFVTNLDHLFIGGP